MVGYHRETHHFREEKSTKELTVPQHTRFILPLTSPDKIHRCAAWAVFFFYGHLSGRRPLHLANARPFGRSKAPLGLLLLRKRGILLSEETKNPNPSPIEKRFGFSLFGAMEGTRTPGLLIRRNRIAHFVHFIIQRQIVVLIESQLFFPLLFCCILCIACTPLHLLSILAMCRKCAKVCSAKISPAKQAVSHSPKSWISTVFIVQNLPVLSKQQSYMRHRFYGRV